MINLLASLTFFLAFLHTLTKGYYMEGRIDKIDVKRDHQELIKLYYRLELKAFIQTLLYTQGIDYSIKY